MRFEGDLYQIGVVVNDIDQGMDHYRNLLGLGPFWRLDTDYQGRYRDWKGRFANKNAFARWGNVYLEMIQPVIGEGNAKEWLKTRGEGIFHLGYAVDDLKQRPQGLECVFECIGAKGDLTVVHLDTVAQLGYYVELSQRAMVDELTARIDLETSVAA